MRVHHPTIHLKPRGPARTLDLLLTQSRYTQRLGHRPNLQRISKRVNSLTSRRRQSLTNARNIMRFLTRARPHLTNSRQNVRFLNRNLRLVRMLSSSRSLVLKINHSRHPRSINLRINDHYRPMPILQLDRNVNRTIKFQRASPSLAAINQDSMPLNLSIPPQHIGPLKASRKRRVKLPTVLTCRNNHRTSATSTLSVNNRTRGQHQRRISLIMSSRTPIPNVRSFRINMRAFTFKHRSLMNHGNRQPSLFKLPTMLTSLLNNRQYTNSRLITPLTHYRNIHRRSRHNHLHRDRAHHARSHLTNAAKRSRRPKATIGHILHNLPLMLPRTPTLFTRNSKILLTVSMTNRVLYQPTSLRRHLLRVATLAKIRRRH